MNEEQSRKPEQQTLPQKDVVIYLGEEAFHASNQENPQNSNNNTVEVIDPMTSIEPVDLINDFPTSKSSSSEQPRRKKDRFSINKKRQATPLSSKMNVIQLKQPGIKSNDLSEVQTASVSPLPNEDMETRITKSHSQTQIGSKTNRQLPDSSRKVQNEDETVHDLPPNHFRAQDEGESSNAKQLQQQLQEQKQPKLPQNPNRKKNLVIDLNESFEPSFRSIQLNNLGNDQSFRDNERGEDSNFIRFPQNESMQGHQQEPMINYQEGVNRIIEESSSPKPDDIGQDKIENESTTSKVIACKVCLDEATSGAQGGLLNPCQCTGTCKYIHEECLKEWIKSKIKNDSNKTNPYILAKAVCEICKYRYRMKFQSKLTFSWANAKTRMGKRNLILGVTSLFCMLGFITAFVIILIFNLGNDSDSVIKNNQNQQGNQNENSFQTSEKASQVVIIVVFSALIVLCLSVCLFSLRSAFFKHQIFSWSILQFDPNLLIEDQIKLQQQQLALEQLQNQQLEFQRRQQIEQERFNRIRQMNQLPITNQSQFYQQESYYIQQQYFGERRGMHQIQQFQHNNPQQYQQQQLIEQDDHSRQRSIILQRIRYAQNQGNTSQQPRRQLQSRQININSSRQNEQYHYELSSLPLENRIEE